MQPPRTREGEQGLPQSLNMETWVEHFRRPQPKSGRTRGGWMKRLWLRKKNTPPCERIWMQPRLAVDICQPEEEQQIGRHRFEISHHLGSSARHPGCNCTTGAPGARSPILGMCQPLARSRHKSARGAGLHLRAVQNGSGDGGVSEVQGISLAISGR